MRAFTRAADAGHPGAQRALADNYDDARSVALYRSAADSGDTLAMIRLGMRYATGNGVAEDPVAAAVLFERAAKRSNVDAMALAGQHLDRMGRQQEARAWYVRAAERKHRGAMMAAANA